MIVLENLAAFFSSENICIRVMDGVVVLPIPSQLILTRVVSVSSLDVRYHSTEQ